MILPRPVEKKETTWKQEDPKPANKSLSIPSSSHFQHLLHSTTSYLCSKQLLQDSFNRGQPTIITRQASSLCQARTVSAKADFDTQSSFYILR
jgi:hypothetical protein